nr:uncharacterized protein LOC109768177 [Aegilops tauschii subsp. strangulata]
MHRSSWVVHTPIRILNFFLLQKAHCQPLISLSFLFLTSPTTCSASACKNLFFLPHACRPFSSTLHHALIRRRGLRRLRTGECGRRAGAVRAPPRHRSSPPLRPDLLFLPHARRPFSSTLLAASRRPPPRPAPPRLAASRAPAAGRLRSLPPPAETMLLWGLGQPASHRPNAFARQGLPAFPIDACGRRLTLHQQPSSFRGASGVTGAVVWDSTVVLAKFLEHAADGGLLSVRGARAVDLGAGCGLVAALLGARVVPTDLPDRVRLLRKNLEENVGGSATVAELVWGDEYEVDPELLLRLDPEPPELVLGSDPWRRP